MFFALFLIGAIAAPNCNSCSTQLNTLQPWTCTCTSSVTSPSWSKGAGCPSSLTVTNGVLRFTPAVGQAGTVTCAISDGSGSQTLTLQIDSAFVRIACGTTANVNDGGLYLSDRNFSVGNTATFCVSDTNISQRRRCSRWLGSTTTDLVYTLVVPNGQFTCILEMMEIFNGIVRANQRVFDAVVNGQTLNGIDLFAIAGFEGVADRTFSGVSVTNGILTITLKRRVGFDNPTINGIVIIPAGSGPTPTPAPTPAPSPSPSSRPVFTSTPPTVKAIPFGTWTYNPVATQSPTSWNLATSSVSSFVTVNGATGAVSVRPTNAQAGTSISFGINACNSAGCTTQNIVVACDDAFIRVNVGGSALVTPDGLTWRADTNSTFGLTFSNSSANPTNFPAALCQAQRFAPPGQNLVYRFTAPAVGNYIVETVGCEIWNGAFGVGRRVFNINVQGALAISNVDLFARGATQAVTLPASLSITNIATPIIVQYTHVTENPQIAAISVRFGGSGTTPTPSPTPTPTPTPTCSSPFVRDAQGNCVSNSNGCSAFQNQWDCARGCVNTAAGGVFNVCQGGTCVNGQCVAHQLTAAEVTSARAVIEAFINQREAAEAATANLVGAQPGDCVGAIIRSAFHSVSTRKAEACLFVFPCTNCEFDNAHNDGLEDIVASLRTVYNNANLWMTMTMTDYVYLAMNQAVVHASQGNINPVYSWGRTQCRCMTTVPTTSCVGGLVNTPQNAMPDAEDTLAAIQNIMENPTGGGMGFTSTEWRCLLGAHALGRGQPNNTGYARHWVNTPNRLDNGYAVTLADTTLPWSPEPGVANPGQLNPAAGKTQYCISGSPGSGRMMLKADIRSFWSADGANNNCILTHAGGGCPPLNELSLLNQWAATPSTWFSCFKAAFEKMCNMGQTLRAPL